MEVKNEPLERVTTESGHTVLRYCEEDNYSDPFGFEWETYQRTYTDSTADANISLRRLEINLGFPVEFLKNMNVLELGCGQGRFTEQLVKYAKHVVAVDMSKAVYYNSALGADNLTAIRADLMKVPELGEDIDLVFCRGVIQHTPDPRKTLQRLFDYVPNDGLVIFDVYKKHGGEWRSPKVWRHVFPKLFSIESFNGFIDRHDRRLYDFHHGYVKFARVTRLGHILARTPFMISFDWEEQYPQVPKEHRIEIFKNELIDGFYSGYDNPLSTEEVIEALAQIGQTPYNYDAYRNHFRCRKSLPTTPIKVNITKNGVVPIG